MDKMNKESSILLWIIIIIGIIIAIYIEFFKCGGFSGNFADIPRWCWWFR